VFALIAGACKLTFTSTLQLGGRKAAELNEILKLFSGKIEAPGRVDTAVAAVLQSYYCSYDIHIEKIDSYLWGCEKSGLLRMLPPDGMDQI
jgi:hypothetical protein